MLKHILLTPDYSRNDDSLLGEFHFRFPELDDRSLTSSMVGHESILIDPCFLVLSNRFDGSCCRGFNLASDNVADAVHQSHEKHPGTIPHHVVA